MTFLAYFAWIPLSIIALLSSLPTTVNAAGVDDHQYVYESPQHPGKVFILAGSPDVIALLKTSDPDFVKVVTRYVFPFEWRNYIVTSDGVTQDELYFEGPPRDAQDYWDDPPTVELPEQTIEDPQSVLRFLEAAEANGVGEKLVQFIRNPGHPHHLIVKDDSVSAVMVSLERENNIDRIIVKIPGKNLSLVQAAGQLFNHYIAFLEDLKKKNTIPWSALGYYDDYRLVVMGNDEFDIIIQRSNNMRQKWGVDLLKVVNVYGNTFEFAFSASGAGSVIIGVAKLRDGDLWGILDMAPCLGAFKKVGGVAWRKIEDLKIFKVDDLVNGLPKPGSEAILKMTADEIEWLASLRNEAPDIFSKDKLTDFADILTKRYGKVWPKWAKTIMCQGDRCIAAGQLVQTGNGRTAIEKLTIGDEILVAVGDRRVEKQAIREVRFGETTNIQRIEVGGVVIECTPDHLLLSDRSGVQEWKPACAVRAGDYLTGVEGIFRVESSDYLRLNSPTIVVGLTVGWAQNFVVSDRSIIVHNGKCGVLFLHQLGGGSEVGGMRKLLTDYTKFDQFYQLAATASKVNPMQFKSTARAISQLMYDITPGFHEWIPRTNVSKILSETVDSAAAHKLMMAMDALRSPAKELWFNAKGLGKDGFIWVNNKKYQLGHGWYPNLNPPMRGLGVAGDWHKLMNDTFENALIRDGNGLVTGFDKATWHLDMTKGVKDFFKGVELGEINLLLGQHFAKLKAIYP